MSGAVRPRLSPRAERATLPAAEGPRRHVVRLPRGPEGPLRTDDEDARIIDLLDGTRSPAELVAAADAALGVGGAPRLMWLLTELAERDLLEGVRPAGPGARAEGRAARWLRPRSRDVMCAPLVIARLYRWGGRLLVTQAAALVALLLTVGGLVAALSLLSGGRVAPLVVDGGVVLGAAIFLGCRAMLVLAHELAHGLALARCGRTVDAAGIRLLLVFPYAFVDTSPVWLEPRRRRTAVTLAGPLCDLALGGSAAIVAALATDPLTAQIAFQVCVAAYVGALLNLNPLLDRDGYHLLVDRLDEPHLRRRALQRMQRRLAGGPAEDGGRPLVLFAIATLVWGVVGATLAGVALMLTSPVLREALPAGTRWWVVVPLWLVLLAPTVYLVARPLRLRLNPTEGLHA